MRRALEEAARTFSLPVVIKEVECTLNYKALYEPAIGHLAGFGCKFHVPAQVLAHVMTLPLILEIQISKLAITVSVFGQRTRSQHLSAAT